MKKFVKTSVVVPGFHQWKKAPAAVEFLRDRHRHLFRIRATLEVTNSDREVEFFYLQNEIQAAIVATFEVIYSGFDFKNNSCENIAEIVATYLKNQNYSVYEVEVFEDDESSGIFRFE